MKAVGGEPGRRGFVLARATDGYEPAVSKHPAVRAALDDWHARQRPWSNVAAAVVFERAGPPSLTFADMGGREVLE